MKRSGLNVMARLIGLVRPMLGFMLLAIAMGLLGNLCATFITVFGGYASLHWRGASCAMQSNPATISSPSSSWP